MQDYTVNIPINLLVDVNEQFESWADFSDKIIPRIISIQSRRDYKLHLTGDDMYFESTHQLQRVVYIEKVIMRNYSLENYPDLTEIDELWIDTCFEDNLTTAALDFTGNITNEITKFHKKLNFCNLEKCSIIYFSGFNYDGKFIDYLGFDGNHYIYNINGFKLKLKCFCHQKYIRNIDEESYLKEYRSYIEI